VADSNLNRDVVEFHICLGYDFLTMTNSQSFNKNLIRVLVLLVLINRATPAIDLPNDPPLLKLTNVARSAGITAITIYGDERKNKYLLETTGCGAAFLDYDNDGWLDIFLVNGTRLAGLLSDQLPTNHLYRNNGDGTFTPERAGGKGFALAIMIMTGSTIFS
jgi:hypothetical protein